LGRQLRTPLVMRTIKYFQPAMKESACYIPFTGFSYVDYTVRQQQVPEKAVNLDELCNCLGVAGFSPAKQWVDIRSVHLSI
jgi:hypothetical protein